MRNLQAQVTAEPFGGGFRLRIKTVTGEELGVELSPERSEALRSALSPSAAPAMDAPAAEAAPAAKSKKPRRR